MDKILIIANPKAGGKIFQKHKPKVNNFFNKHNVKGEIRIWEEIDLIDYMVEQAKDEGFQTIIAAGGDGTVHHIGKRLINTDIKLGVLPIGTGNSLANHFGISHNIEKALELHINPKVVSIDTLQMNGLPFICFAGTGLDAEVIHAFTNVKHRSFFTYFILILKVYTYFKPVTIISKYFDQRETTRKDTVLGIVACNLSQFGNGSIVAPGASTVDGKFDVVMLKMLPIFAFPNLAIKIFNGTLDKNNCKYYDRYLTSEAVFKRESDCLVQVDGEPYTMKGDLKFEIVPKSLKLVIGDPKTPI